MTCTSEKHTAVGDSSEDTNALSAMSKRKELVQELVSLSWLALSQKEAIDGVIDDETYQFFTSSPLPPPPSLPEIKQKPSLPISSPTPTKPPTPPPQKEQEEISPHDEIVDLSDAPPQQSNKRLEKLLPRPFASSTPDTTQTRKHIATSSSIPHLSEVQLYQESPSNCSSKRWAVFSYLSSTQPPSPKELFVKSVVKAISERLPVSVTMYSCYDPSFGLHLPVIADDCEVVLFFVDGHLESTLTSLLESVKAFSRTSPPIESPFASLGSVNGRPLRTLLLHAATHDDTAIKSSLWQSLKALATLTPPE